MSDATSVVVGRSDVARCDLPDGSIVWTVRLSRGDLDRIPRRWFNDLDKHFDKLIEYLNEEAGVE